MSDKRSVSTDALETLGNIIEGGGRDAIHLAVEPVVAAEDLYAGQHVGLSKDGAITNGVEKLGIVDPFIVGVVPKGKMFWLVVYPRTITSLRHVWEHPKFDKKIEPTQKETSAKWLVDFAISVGLQYDVLMEGADDYLNHGEYLSFGGLLEGEYVPEEFWEHYEKVRGVKVNKNDRGSFFSCSC